MKFLAEEDFSIVVVGRLRSGGLDVVTLQELGWGNQGTAHSVVLELAASLQRCLLSCNRRDFLRLDRQRGGQHSGMVLCSHPPDPEELARKVLALFDGERADGEDLAGCVVRVNRG